MMRRFWINNAADDKNKTHIKNHNGEKFIIQKEEEEKEK